MVMIEGTLLILTESIKKLSLSYTIRKNTLHLYFLLKSFCIHEKQEFFASRLFLCMFVYCFSYAAFVINANRWLIKTDKTERFTTAFEAKSPVSSEISDLQNF